MRIDYKFWYIERDDYDFINKAAIRFYEGDYETVTVDGVDTIVYNRGRRLDASDLTYINNLKTVFEANGNTAILFDRSDFGLIQTDEELCAFLNQQIAKDPGRQPINEQAI